MNAHEPAFPNVQPEPERIDCKVEAGLTKREHFAALAMAAFCSAEWTKEEDYTVIALMAVDQADALLNVLDRAPYCKPSPAKGGGA